MRIAWRLITYIKQVSGLFIIGMGLLIMATLGQQITPFFIRRLIDQVLTPVSQGAIFDSSNFWQIAGLYLGVLLAAKLAAYGAARVLMHVANRVVEYLRNLCFLHLQQLPIAYFDDKPAGKISARIVNDTETLRSQFYGSLLSQFIMTILPVVIIYVIVFRIHLLLGGCLLGLIPIFFIWQRIFAKRTEGAMTTYYEARSEVNSHVNEAIHGSEMIQLYHQSANFKEAFNQTAQAMYQADLKLIDVEATISWSLVETINRSFILIILAIVGHQFIGHESVITTGTLYVILDYTSALFEYLGMMVRQLPTMQRSITTGKRVLELLDAEPEKDTQAQLEVKHGEVTFEQVGFAYKEAEWVLKEVQFEVKQGQSIALVGHTGSGKSSIMNLLFRFYDPQKGRILIDGQDIQAFNRESVRSEMGIVLQDPYLFSGTIASNVHMGNPAIDDSQVKTALEKVGAKAMIDRLAHGIHEPILDKGNSFSSGERQLIAFARTLAANPKILILDEATSHIDTETEEMIQAAMAVVKEGRTTFIIAHRLSTIQNCDQIILLDQGRIVEQGTHQDLLKMNGLYAQMYRVQQTIATI